MVNAAGPAIRAGLPGRAFDAANYLFLTLFAVSVIYPFWDLFIASLSTPADAITLKTRIVPNQITVDSYRTVLTGGRVGIAYLNTILRAAIGTTAGILVIFSAAYALSKKSLPFRHAITVYLLVTIFFSGGFIPSYLLVKNLGLIDTRAALILPMLVNVFHLLIVRTYVMATVERSLEESAQLDGANHVTIMLRIVMPVCKPVIGTLALWTIVAHWNSWFDAMIYTNDPGKTVLQLQLRRIWFDKVARELHLMEQYAIESRLDYNALTLQAAFLFVTIAPILLVYPFLQRYFVKGIMLGSLKG